MEEVKFETGHKVGIPDKNNNIYTEDFYKAISYQVSRAYNLGKPKVLTTSNFKYIKENRKFCLYNSKDIIGIIKEFTTEYTIIEIPDCKKELVDRLIKDGYKPTYRCACKIDNINGSLYPKNPNLICFDMIKIEPNNIIIF